MLPSKPKKGSRKMMQLPVIHSMKELEEKLGEKAYLGLKKRIETDKNKKG